jgi:DNA polymerase elongation subunit (family B)
MYETPTSKGTLDVKGMALVKGDSSELTRTLQLKVITAIMQKPKEAWSTVESLVKEAITEIKTIDKTKLIKHVKLGSDYKNPEAVISFRVAKRIKVRGQQEPQPGELVPFLVGISSSTKIVDRADYPDHVTNIDYSYYIDRQIIKPLTRILDVLKCDWREIIIY